MSTVLIIPEKNEGRAPLFVAEAGLKSTRVEAIYFVDGWSTDDTFAQLTASAVEMTQRYGKRVATLRSEIRETGKGGAMATGLRRALQDGFSHILFLDGDISSVTPQWCDLLADGLTQHDAAMTRGYFDRSPLDAQITRHITRPLLALYFPEGIEVQQPLGGELGLTAQLANHLVNGPIAPPHTWGIDTFLTVNALAGGFPVLEIYLTQKTHTKKALSELRGMIIECFDEMVKEIYFHGRHRRVPANARSLVRLLPRDQAPPRIGEDVRTQRYVDLEAQVANLFAYARTVPHVAERLAELGVDDAARRLILSLLEERDFRERSRALNAQTWIPLLDAVVRGYLEKRFASAYHDLIFLVWQLRATAFALNEATSFEAAEAQTAQQARYAYEYGEKYRT